MATQQDYIVLKLSAVAARTEVTPGTDIIGGAPVSSDWLGGEATVRLPQQAAEDPSMTGSLDENAPIPTGIKPEITIRMPVRGAGIAGTAPEWGRLMKACRFDELLTATAIGAPTAATAGGASSLTLPAPFAAVDKAYLGMPIALSGNPVTPIILPVSVYTSARMAYVNYGITLSTATLAQILPNALYTPTSDPTKIKPVTIYGYMNGLRHRFTGCVGTARLEMSAGGVAYITFTMRGLLLDAYQAVATPAGSAISRVQAPVWLNGVSRLDGSLCNCSRFNWELGVELVDPENPEAPQGFDNPIIVSARQRIEIDPFANSTRSPTRFSKYQTGQAAGFSCTLGQTAGNRISVSMPLGIITAFDAGNRNKLGVDQMTLTPNQPDAGVFLAAY